MSADPLETLAAGDAAAAGRRRRQLVDATLAVISSHGLHGTTLARVARTAGLSPGIVNHYFKTKDALLLATLTHTASEFEQQWREVVGAAAGGAAGKLRALVEWLFDPMLFDSRRVAVWTAFWGEARARADYMRVCGESDRAYYEQVLALVREVVREGGYAGVDADAVGRALFSLLDTLPEDGLAEPAAFEPDAARRTCLAFLASLFPRDFEPLPAGAGDTAGEDSAPSPAVRLETLPGWTYDNAEFLELEKEHLFRRQWQLVGHVSEVPAAGDYMTLDAVGERIAVVRDNDGTLHAFHNVCRHRASRVVAGDRGHCERALTCPYHGWTYAFDGRLRGVPEADSFGSLDTRQVRLPPVELEVWMGFVFVRIKPERGPGVAEMLQPWQAELAPYRLADLQPHGAQWQRNLAVNWKAVRDNDSEGYHVRIGHPGLQRLFGDSYYDEVGEHGVGRSFCRLLEQRSPGWSEGHYQALLPEATHLPASHRRVWLYFGLFPSLSLGIYPDMVEYYQVFPIGTGEACLRGRSFALPDERREMRAARWLNARINEQVWKEDLNFCFWTDAGVRSSSYAGGPLSEREIGVRDFHDRVRALLPVARRPRAPAIGRVAEVNADLLAATS